MKLNEFCTNLENKIETSYKEGTTVEGAERLAAEFLHAQLLVSSALKKVDLDARMKKSGVKGVRAAVYLEKAKEGDKKPSDVMLNALVDTNEIVQKQQDLLDTAESDRAELERYYDIFCNAHIFYRGIAKGRFE